MKRCIHGYGLYQAVGSELAAQAKVQTLAYGTEYPGASGQWLPRFSPRERNADEQFRSIAEIAPAAARSRGWVARHGVDLPHVISEDSKRVAAQLGNAVWGILDANGRRNENGSGVEPPKPFSIN